MGQWYLAMTSALPGSHQLLTFPRLWYKSAFNSWIKEWGTKMFLTKRSALSPWSKNAPVSKMSLPAFRRHCRQVSAPCPCLLQDPYKFTWNEQYRGHVRQKHQEHGKQHPWERRESNKLSAVFHSIDLYLAYFFVILAITKCQRVSAALRGCDEVPHIGLTGYQKWHKVLEVSWRLRE